MRTKYILLLDETSDGVGYARRNNMPTADTFTSPIGFYEPIKKAEDIASLSKGIWNKIEIHNLKTNKIETVLFNEN